MEIMPTPSGSGPSGAPEPHRVEAGLGAAWWGESWRIFVAAPGAWIGMVVVFAVVSTLLFFIPAVGGILQSVLTPVFAGGVMLGCHALARGERLTVGHLFEGFQGGRLAPLLVLGFIWLAILVGLAIVAVAFAYVALGASGVSALMALGADAQADYVTLTPLLLSAGVAFLVIAMICVTVVLLAAMAYWFAPALVVLNGEPPVSALRKSFDASLRNIGAFLLYSVIYIGLAIVASIPAGLGWLVLGPMVAGSCYAGWRTIFGPPADSRPAPG
ncbi:MAG TPA: BPSS1780 family membrane protein [Casimicrobiaceae bacterium]|nr:BPSS1780 family membrane protein [Casimicrobiaceae bacterium]